MNEKTTERLTREDETRAAEIVRITERLPEKEQERLFMLAKCIELIGSTKANTPQAAAAR